MKVDQSVIDYLHLDLKGQVFKAVLITIGLILGCYEMFFQKKIVQLNILKNDVTELRTASNAELSEQTTMKTLFRSMAVLQHRWEENSRFVMTPLNFSKAWAWWVQAASNVGLSSVSFRPKQGLETAPNASEQFSMTIIFSGYYRALTQLIDYFIQSNLFMTVDDFDLSRSQKILTIKMNVTLYRKLEQVQIPWHLDEIVLDKLKDKFKSKHYFPIVHDPFFMESIAMDHQVTQKNLENKISFSTLCLNEIRMLGTLLESGARSAFIENKEGQVDRVIIGSYLSREKLKVISIDSNHLLLKSQYGRTFKILPLKRNFEQGGL